MRKPFIVCTLAVVLAASAIASPRAEVMTVASPAGTALAQNVTHGGYYRSHSRLCGYYRYVCRAWWTGCGWDGPYLISVPYWGMRYFCF
jgi:hypothetical protein